MTSYFTAAGLQVPVTVIALLPGNVVTQARRAPVVAASRSPSAPRDASRAYLTPCCARSR